MNQGMYEELAQMPHIPAASARAYQEKLTFLLDQVNKMMASRPDIYLLIGNNPINLMFENHRNHALFMDNIFRLNIFFLLPEIVPWVYRSYSNHGFSFDYFPAHLRAWKEAIQEHFDRETSHPILQVYDWMLTHHEEFVELSQKSSFLDLSSLFPESRDQKRFLQALLKGDRLATLDIGRQLVMQPKDLEPFYQGVLQPAMYRIGELWEQGAITVSKEHLASALANTVISSQYVQVMSDAEPGKEKVLVTATTNEFHVLGAQMIANCLEAEGWNVDYLGADTPVMDLVDYVANQEPFIVALSVAMPFNLISAKEIIDRIKGAFHGSRPKILVGGLTFLNHPELAEKIGADGHAAGCRQAVELALYWHEEKTHADDRSS